MINPFVTDDGIVLLGQRFYTPSEALQLAKKLQDIVKGPLLGAEPGQPFYGYTTEGTRHVFIYSGYNGGDGVVSADGELWCLTGLSRPYDVTYAVASYWMDHYDIVRWEPVVVASGQVLKGDGKTSP